MTTGYKLIKQWLASKDRKPFAFQDEVWEKFFEGKSGLLNAPTGCGKTYALYLPNLISWINRHPNDYQKKKNNGLRLMWITPLRALSKDIERAMREVITELDIAWQVGIRTGDTTLAQRQKQKLKMPEVLIITPESLHLLLASKDYPKLFENLETVVIDEWHELLGSKRGVQVELALSRLKGLKQEEAIGKRQEAIEISVQRVRGKKQKEIKNNWQLAIGNLQNEKDENWYNQFSNRCYPVLKIWGISATIGNLDEAMEVLLGANCKDGVIVKANIHKKIEVHSIMPDVAEKFPWTGHLGINLSHKLKPIIEQSKSTLIFTNTRSQSEIWFHHLLDKMPELAGAIALHHGSIDAKLRTWVEDALQKGILKVVVCTSSLDLGVDFRPVETVVQIGSPRGVSRFIQRAGRSGHSPDAVSRIYFMPTHSLELVEAVALKDAIEKQTIETRMPVVNSFDVLIQYLVTLAVGEGLKPDEIYHEVKSTHAYHLMNDAEWKWCMDFITTGGDALHQYDEFKKVENVDGVYRVLNRKIAMRHRLSMGTIVSDNILKVKYLTGRFIGTIEEYFIARLKAGDVFSLAGHTLEFVMLKDMTVHVRKSKAKKVLVPSWGGGRFPLTSNLGELLRQSFTKALKPNPKEEEFKKLQPMFDLQRELSAIPKEDELLVEKIVDKEGFHLFVYPFEGRFVHEVMSALLAYRLGKIKPITFSIAKNDYGFELLSDVEIPINEKNIKQLLSDENLLEDIQASLNAAEMARRKFRDVACIAGLVFQGYPGKNITGRHLQASSSLFFKVLTEFDSGNLLIKQSYTEVFEQQIEEVRLRKVLERIKNSSILLTYPDRLTPFCFPVKVDMIRESMSSERIEDRVKRMTLELEGD
ncbi:MAG: ligase-associated DNA damage response DEXH box helicase [Bacteroidia bacterium]